MTLDTSGDFGINCTPTIRLDVLENDADWAARIKNTHTNGYGLSIDCSANSGTTVFALAAYTGAGTGFFVKNNGTVGLGRSQPNARLDILDPTLKNLKVSKDERDAWIQDQYFHPIESLHTLDEILSWFKNHNIKYVEIETCSVSPCGRPAGTVPEPPELYLIQKMTVLFFSVLC